MTITVTQATPTITWATPAAITYGTALSGTQLNAITQPLVAGTFAYTAGARRPADEPRRRAHTHHRDLHADRCGELHDADRDGDDHRDAGDADE